MFSPLAPDAAQGRCHGANVTSTKPSENTITSFEPSGRFQNLRTGGQSTPPRARRNIAGRNPHPGLQDKGRPTDYLQVGNERHEEAVSSGSDRRLREPPGPARAGEGGGRQGRRGAGTRGGAP